MNLTYVAAQPFKSRGKPVLRERDFIFILSMDLGWFTPREARRALRQAVEEGLLSLEEGMVKPLFNLETVEIPLGYRPDERDERRGVFEIAVERIMTATGMDKHQVISLVNQEQEKLHKLVEIEVSVLLVAKRHGVPVADLAEQAYRNLISASGR